MLPECPLFVLWQDRSEALTGNKSLAGVCWRQRSPHLTPFGICQRAGLSVNLVNIQAVLTAKLPLPTLASSIPEQPAGLMERKQPKPAYCSVFTFARAHQARRTHTLVSCCVESHVVVSQMPGSVCLTPSFAAPSASHKSSVSRDDTPMFKLPHTFGLWREIGVPCSVHDLAPRPGKDGTRLVPPEVQALCWRLYHA